MKWQKATLIETKNLTKNVKSLTFKVANWTSHKSGQHYELRLITDSNKHPTRSFSIASSPEQNGIIEFGIQLLKGGELSTKLFQLKEGNQIEVLGPKGDFFWMPKDNRPLILIAGGTGLVPLISMLRHYYHNPKQRKIILILSVISKKEILFPVELEEYANNDPNLKMFITLTQISDKNWTGFKKRIDQKILEEILREIKNENPRIYISGPTTFVDQIWSNLIKIGFNINSIYRERFGPNIF